MENRNGQELAAVEYDATSNGGHRPPEWHPPRSREEADEAVLNLSNDIGLILAQLAEDQTSWCARTGRFPGDYTAWRRRALFAKVHKEGQLRECKRIRAHLSGAAEADRTLSEHERLADLWDRCERVIRAWKADGALEGSADLNRALGELARHLDGCEPGPPDPRSRGWDRGDNLGLEQAHSRVVLGRRP